MEKTEYQKMDAIENDHAWFLAKYDFLLTILKKVKISREQKIIDIGCGTGAVMKKLSDSGYQVEGIDNSLDALSYCQQKGLTVSNGTAEKIDVPNDYCDVVISLDVLEHLDNDKSAVTEFHRILKTGGYVIATVPAHQFLWSYHDEALHHKRRYGQAEFNGLFAEGFEVVIKSWLHASIFLPTLLMRTLKNKNNKDQSTSDVDMPSSFVNNILRAVYFFEILFFKIFSYLPFGLSLVIVARKKT
ncbi:MAG: class I SAM-dependent methyltransferase [bacterium]